MGRYKLGWMNEEVRCPFYLSDSRETRSIRCEGYVEGMDAYSRFRTLALREKHMGTYCAGRYEKCPLYRCTYASKYADA